MTYEAEVLADSPLVYWRLGEPSGVTAVDDSGNGHDGSIVGGPALGVSGLLVSDADTAVAFDSSGAEQYVKSFDDLGSTTYGAFTVECLVKRTSTGSNYQHLAGLMDGTFTNYLALLFNGFGGDHWFDLEWQGISTSHSTGAGSNPPNIPTGAVHHVVARYDGATAQVYVDGTAYANTVTSSDSPPFPGSAWFFVGSDNQGDPADAVIDEAAFYDYALSEARITAHYNASIAAGPGVPTISSITPPHGATAGGTPVTLVGTNLDLVTDVRVDGVSVGFSAPDSTHITFTTSAHSAGAGLDVTASAPGGTAHTSFDFTDAPAVLDGCVILTAGDFLADGSTPDGDGIVYTVQSLTGWWDTPPVRSETMEAQPTGEYPTVFRENARRPVLVIVAHDPTGTALGGLLCWTAIATVKAAFDALAVPVLMEVADTVNDRSALVRLAAPIRTSILGNTVAVRLEISLLAPNPTLT